MPISIDTRRFARPRADQEWRSSPCLLHAELSPTGARGHHLRRFVGPESDAPLSTGATGERLRPATMFAATGASTKEIMSRGRLEAGGHGGALRTCL